MNQSILKMKDVLLKKSGKFYMIPYHLQYETRDCMMIPLILVSYKTSMNRKKYVKEFNPYLKTNNVSDNLDQSLKDFYNKRYKTR